VTADAVEGWVQATPFGAIRVEVGPHGVEHISMPHPDHFAAPATPRRGARVAKSPVATRVARQLDEYFAGRRTELDVPIDLEASELSDLQRHVLTTLRDEVPYGETITYGELAELAGRPGAARAVGTAMSRNPVPFVVPCHRVVAAGGIGGYGGGAQGVALKRALLDLEARARPTG
jgi:methylated-DNA-[protein]-cysteine S-methyltransferase